jgi:hypothetical protein
MRNLKAFEDNTIAFLDEVVATRRVSGRDPNFLTRIVSYRLGLVLAYTAYDGHFAGGSLLTAVASGHVNPSKADLIKLYSYKAKMFQKLRFKLTTDDNGRLINTCQNCTINEVNSFDHLLPKDEFPEFSVNPKNLFPSCTQCNGYKSHVWRNAAEALFLNLFLDVLPPDRYLYATVTVNDQVEIIYTIENRTGLDNTLFALIASHYQRLHLLSRFRQNSDAVITELIHSVSSYKNFLSKAQIKEVVLQKEAMDLDKFGHNYWKALTRIALIESDDFFDFALRGNLAFP